MCNFKNKVAVVTGGVQGIEKCIREEYKKADATVCDIGVKDNGYFVGDLSDKTTLEHFAGKVIADYGHVDYLINNSAPLSRGITNALYEILCML